MSDERLNNLEMRYAELEQQFEDLNSVVLAQGQIINGLRAKVKAIENAGDDEGSNDRNLSPSEIAARDKPPHY